MLQLTRQAMEKRREEEELAQLRAELDIEEGEKKRRDRERAQAEKRASDRAAMMQANELMLAAKAERMAEDRRQEDELVRKMMEKYAADEKLEQMNAQKRRMRQLEHRRMAEELVAQRRAALEAERQRELDEQREQQRREELRRQIIEQERRRLLREHAPQLINYLPKVCVVCCW